MRPFGKWRQMFDVCLSIYTAILWSKRYQLDGTAAKAVCLLILQFIIFSFFINLELRHLYFWAFQNGNSHILERPSIVFILEFISRNRDCDGTTALTRPHILIRGEMTLCTQYLNISSGHSPAVPLFGGYYRLESCDTLVGRRSANYGVQDRKLEHSQHGRRIMATYRPSAFFKANLK